MEPDEEASQTDNLLVIGSVKVSVYIDTDTGEEMIDTTVDNLTPYQLVGILEHAKFEALGFGVGGDDE